MSGIFIERVCLTSSAGATRNDSRKDRYLERNEKNNARKLECGKKSLKIALERGNNVRGQ